MPNWKKVIVSGSDAVLNKATLSDNLLVTPTTQSAAHSGLLLGFSKYSTNFEAGLFAATDGRIGGSNGNLYIAPRNINSGNGSYLVLGQRDSTTASDKGTVILQAGRSGSNSQVGDMFFGYGDQKTMKLHGATGNVGIGNLLPPEKLTIEGNISSSGTGSFSVLGVGIKSPFLPLHVDGNARIDGNLLVGNCASTNTPAADFHIKSSGTDAKLRIEDLDDDNLAYDFLVNSGSGLTITETTDATSRIHIKQGNGRVGIGTASPSAQLQVNSQDSNFEILRLVGDTTEHGSLKIYSGSYNTATLGYHQQGYFMNSAQSSNPNGAFFIRGDKGLDFGAAGTGSLSIQSGSANIIIDSKVEVGIGTAEPTEKLQVEGNISASGHISGSSIVASNVASSNVLTTLKAINTNGVAEFGTQSGYSRIISQGTLRYATSPSIHFWYDSSGTTPMILADNGNLGLGTGAAPPEKLTVVGNISASGTIIGNNLIVPSAEGIVLVAS
jgi:hypothetical protein